MISYLEGQTKFRGLNFLIILVNGVGYKVYVPVDVITKSETGKAISIYTFTVVKEDVLDLYGFPTPEDLAMFELLLSVSGIGPKTALGIFGIGTITRIKEAIVKGEISFFTGVPRLGSKNAQKIIIELRGKLGNLGLLDLTAESPEDKEIIEALKTFGFSQNEAKEALKFLTDFRGSTSEKIRQALKFLGKKK